MEQNNTVTYSTMSVPDWKGIKSEKFSGSRSHKHHPTNELNYLL